MLCDVGGHEANLDALGPEVHALYDALYQQQNTLDAVWQEFRKLYASSPERIEVLNGTAPFFFRVVQELLWRDVLLRISRLLDPVKVAGKLTLTVRRLPSAVSDPVLSAELDQLVQEAISKSKVPREWRNRQIAHTDLGLALGSDATSLPEVNVRIIEEALASLRAILSRLDPTVHWGEPLVYGDADALAHYLENGVAHVHARRNRRAV